MLKHVSLVLVLLLGDAVHAAAQPSVFIIRHAERADAAKGVALPKGADPDLSDSGRTRAQSLADALKDAHITAIFATEFKRTQQTAAPLAKALGLTVTTVASKEAGALLQKVETASGNVLVVGHTNTIPDLVRGLGVSTPVTIEESEYDNLFIVVRGTKPVLIRLHYR